MPLHYLKIPKAGLALSLLIIIIAVAIVSIRQTKATNAAASWVAHTEEVLFRSEKMLSIITETETGSRAYVLTGQPYFLETFIGSKKELQGAFDTLRKLTADNHSQQARIDTLFHIVSKRIAFSDSIVHLKENIKIEAALQLVAESKSDLYVNNVRQSIGRIQDEENNLLEVRKKTRRHEETTAYFVFLLIIFFVLVLLILLFWKEGQLAGKEQQKKSEVMFRSLLESAPDAIIIANEQGEIVLINQQTETLFGYKRDELIGRPVEILVPVNFHDKHVGDRTQYFANPKVRSMGAGLELFAIRKDGTQFPVEISLSPWVTKDGTLISAAIRDITERRNEEEKLKKAKKDFQLLVSSVKDYAIFLLDKEGNIASWNSGAEHIKGYTAEEIIGKPMEVFYPAEEIQKGEPKKNLQKALRNGHFETEGLRLRKDGSTFYANIVFTPLFDDQGQLHGYAKVTKDITDKRKADEQISFLASIANSIQDPVISADNDSLITRWNDAAEELLEWKNEEVIGKSASETFKTIFPYESRQQILDTLTDKNFWQGEVIYHTKSGRPVNVLSTISYLKNAEGNRTGSLVLVRDITKRKNAEEALSKLNAELEERIIERSAEISKSEKRFRALIENNYDVISLADETYNIFYRSPSSFRVTGWTDDELKNIDRAKYVHPDDIEKAISITMESVANPGKPIPFLVRNLHKNGHYIWVEGLTTNMLQDENVKAMVFNFRDVTERVEAEEKLIKSEKIYKTIASSIPGSIICLLDREYRYLLMEGDMIEKLGYSKKKLLGNKAEDVLSPEIFASVKNELKGALQGETVTRESSSFGYDIISRFIPLKDENDAVYAIMTVATDVTQLKNAQRDIAELNRGLEEKIIQRTAQLESVNKELESFSYSVSHDLRAPLRIIDGFGQILMEDYSEKLDEEGQETVKVIMKSAQKMGHLIDDLLSFSKLGRSEMRVSKVNMNDLVKEVLIELETSGITIPARLKVHKLKIATGDSNLLKQVWINLISNAIKYSSGKKDPVIEIGMTEKKDIPVYYVKDNGAGFDMQYADKLFGVFQRLHKEEEFAGTGVGLALVQRIVLRHEGTIWAEAKENEGATFYFTLS